MYRQSETEIKREVITDSQEMEVTVKIRGRLTPNQIKEITEIADKTSKRLEEITFKGEPDQEPCDKETAGK